MATSRESGLLALADRAPVPMSSTERWWLKKRQSLPVSKARLESAALPQAGAQLAHGRGLARRVEKRADERQVHLRQQLTPGGAP